MENDLTNGMLGLAIGDAFGLPFEYVTRSDLRRNPVTDWSEGGKYGQKMGTWSDITSMSMATLESLCEKREIDPDDVFQKFLIWKAEDDYTPHEEVVRMDDAVVKALKNYTDDVPVSKCGVGQGQLAEGDSYAGMTRMYPLAYFLEERYGSFNMRELTQEEMDAVHECAAWTNACKESQVAAAIYVAVAREIMSGTRPDRKAVTDGLKYAFDYYDKHPEFNDALIKYTMLRNTSILMPDPAISSGHDSASTLIAAIWCLLKTLDSETDTPFQDTVLRAVNLGDNASGVAAVAGSLAGAMFGYEAIPEVWKETVARRIWIENICRDYIEGPVKPDTSEQDAEEFDMMQMMSTGGDQ